jgi:transposase InsO family protein
VPWKESGVVNERMNFVMRVRDGERVAELCREYGISRKTGYKFLERFERMGPVGLYDEKRVAQRLPHRVPDAVVRVILEAKKKFPTWGARKLRVWLLEKQPGVSLPATSTISDLLKRNGLVKERRRRRRTTPSETARPMAESPNSLWCCDYKGQFQLVNRSMCYPLTLTDQASRYVLGCEGMSRIRTESTQTGMELVFRKYGLPFGILSDNGTPFGSTGLLGLSRLSVWWKRLGIAHYRIDPGHPEQNGAHERMHGTLKAETTRPAAHNLLQQQERFDRFLDIFNNQRPHEALDMKTPASVYAASPRPFPNELDEPEYPLHDFTKVVSAWGHLSLGRKRHFFISNALAGQRIGLKEIDSDRLLVTFVDLDLGWVDLRTNVFQPREVDGK